MARQYKTGLIITGDAKGGIRAINATEKELGQLNQGFGRGARRSRQFARSTGGVSRELQVLRRAAAPVAAAVAGLFAVSSLRQQVDFADQLQKTNLRIGASTEALSEYNYVAQLSGVQFNQLTTAWQRQSRRIAQAAENTGEAQDALATLNLDAAALAQLSPEEQFEQIAEAMGGVASEARRVALAQKIWDSEGVALLQVVNQGADAIETMREEARRLGLTISQDTAEAMAGLNDEVTRLQAVGTGLSRQILAELVPAMTAGLQTTSDWIDAAGGAAEILDVLQGTAATLATLLAARYAGALGTAAAAKLAATQQAVAYQAALARMAGVSRMAAASQTALAGATRGAAAAMGMLGGPLGAAVLAGAAIYTFREELGLVQPRMETATERVDNLTDALTSNSRAALESARSMLEAEQQLAQFSAASLAMEREKLRQRVFAEQEQWDAIGGQAAFGMGGRSESQEALHQLEVQLTDVRQAGKAAAEGIAEVDERLAQIGQGGSGAMTRVYSESADAARAARAETDALADSYQALYGRIRPLEATQRQYADDKATLVAYALRENMATLQLVSLLGDLEESYRTAKSAAEVYGFTGKSAVQEVNQAARDLGFSFESAFESAVIRGQGLRGVLQGILQDVARIVLRETVTAPIGGVISDGLGDLLPFASGGYTGPGPRHRPAGVVHAGEYVVRKSVVDRPGVRPALERLNRGYASGGYVTPPGAASAGPLGGANITIHAPITVQAQPGVSDEAAQRQGRQMGRAFEAEVMRILQKQQRPGGMLSGANG